MAVPTISTHLTDVPDLPMANIFKHLPIVDLRHADEVCKSWGHLKRGALLKRQQLVIAREERDDMPLVEVLASHSSCFELLRLVQWSEKDQESHNQDSNVTKSRFHLNTLYTGTKGYIGPPTYTAITNLMMTNLTCLTVVLRSGRVSELVELVLILEQEPLCQNLRQLTLLFWADRMGGKDKAQGEDFLDAFRSIFTALNGLSVLDSLTLNLRLSPPLGLIRRPQECLLHQRTQAWWLPRPRKPPIELSTDLVRRLRHFSIRTSCFGLVNYSRIYLDDHSALTTNSNTKWDIYETLGLEKQQLFSLEEAVTALRLPPYRLEQLYIGNSMSLATALGEPEEEEEEDWTEEKADADARLLRQLGLTESYARHFIRQQPVRVPPPPAVVPQDDPRVEQHYSFRQLFAEAAATRDRLCAATRELSIGSLEKPLGRADFERLQRFAVRFSNLEHLSVVLMPELSVAMLARALAPVCTRLSHLTIAVNFSWDQETNQGQPQPPEEVSMMSVKALSLEIVTTSHRDFEKMHLEELFPAVEVISLTHLFHLCSDCLNMRMPFQQQQRPQHGRFQLQEQVAIFALWEGEQRIKAHDILYLCMKLVRARLFAGLPRLKTLQANTSLSFHFSPKVQARTFTRQSCYRSVECLQQMIAAAQQQLSIEPHGPLLIHTPPLPPEDESRVPLS